jgi:hypothetical protein
VRSGDHTDDIGDVDRGERRLIERRRQVDQNAAAGAPALPAYAIVAQALEDAVFVAIWQVLGMIALGIFFIGVGRQLRPEHRSLGTLTILLGGLAFIVFLARVAGLEPVAVMAILVLLPLMTLWFGWLAFSALRAERPDLALAA